jgi:ABC-type phosphate transport system substrate-binding protein
MRILRTKTTRLAATAALTLGAAGAALAVGTATATAAAHPEYRSCSNNGSGTCTTVDSKTTLYSPSNVALDTLPAGTEIEVTCWYSSGGTGDGYLDHVSWAANYGNADGHVSDEAVDFGGNTPPLVGVPEC